MAASGVPEWDPDEQKKTPGYLYERLADHIAARIAAGDYPPNAMLPNEREQVAEYGVSIDTVRRAIAELRDRGLVITIPNKGTYIAPLDTQDAPPGNPDRPGSDH